MKQSLKLRSSWRTLATLALLLVLSWPALTQEKPVPEEKISSLIKQLKSEDWKVRVEAARVLITSGSMGREVVSALIEALGDDNYRVRFEVVSALGMIASQDKEVIPALVEALKHPKGRVREYAVSALARTGSETQEVINALILALRDENGDVGEAAGVVLARKAANFKEVVPALVEALSDERDQVRVNAASSLERVGSGANEAVPALTKALKDSEWRVRVFAAQALGAIGPAAKEAASALKKLTEDSENEVRKIAAEALTKIEHPTAVQRAAQDVSARLWDTETGKLIRTFVGHNRPVTVITFSPDGSRIVTGSITDELRVWDVASGNQVNAFKAPHDVGYVGMTGALEFNSDGSRLLEGREKSILIRDPATGRIVHRLSPQPVHPAQTAFSPDDKTILAIDRSWDATTGRHIGTFVEEWRFAGKTFVTLSSNGTARAWWNAENGTEVAASLVASATSASRDYSAVLSPDGAQLLAWAWLEYTCRLWEVSTGKLLWVVTKFPRIADQDQDQNPARAKWSYVVFSPDGHHFLTAPEDGQARLWDARTGKEVRTIGNSPDGALGVAFSPDGTKIATWRSNALKLWDSKTGQALVTLHAPSFTCIAFSRDGKKIITGGYGEFRGL